MKHAITSIMVVVIIIAIASLFIHPFHGQGIVKICQVIGNSALISGAVVMLAVGCLFILLKLYVSDVHTTVTFFMLMGEFVAFTFFVIWLIATTIGRLFA